MDFAKNEGLIHCSHLGYKGSNVLKLDAAPLLSHMHSLIKTNRGTGPVTLEQPCFKTVGAKSCGYDRKMIEAFKAIISFTANLAP